jgi:hypothetical protein
MAIFTLTPRPETPGERVSLIFTADGPARFELIVEADGSTVLFGYSGVEEDQDQAPNLVFDTDGSLAVFTDDEA